MDENHNGTNTKPLWVTHRQKHKDYGLMFHNGKTKNRYG